MAAHCRAASRRSRSAVTRITRSATLPSRPCGKSGGPGVSSIPSRAQSRSRQRHAPIADCAGACSRPKNSRILKLGLQLRRRSLPASPALDPRSPASERVAVVIPTLNEAESIGCGCRHAAARHRRARHRGRWRQQRRHRGNSARRRRRGDRRGPQVMAAPALPARWPLTRATSWCSWMATAPTIRAPSRNGLRAPFAGNYDFVIGSRIRGSARPASMAGHQIFAGRRGRPDPAALRRALHRHGGFAQSAAHPFLAGHARTDLRLESGNADAGSTFGSAHDGNSGSLLAAPAGNRKSPAISSARQSSGSDRRHFRAGCDGVGRPILRDLAEKAVHPPDHFAGVGRGYFLPPCLVSIEARPSSYRTRERKHRVLIRRTAVLETTLETESRSSREAV